MFAWLSKLLKSSPPPKREALDYAADLHWIAAAGNPWGVDILDCRTITLNWYSTTENPAVVDSFAELRSSSGQQHCAAEPLPYEVPEPIELDIPVAAPEGALYRAHEMEEKWDIYHWKGVVYVCRSWTGDLVYTARIACDGTRTLLEEIRTIKPDAGYARRELYFLMQSHTQRQMLPGPLPVLDPPEPENKGEKALAGWHMFTTFGRFGWFATVADMTDKPLVPPEVLKPWLDAHPMQPSRRKR